MSPGDCRHFTGIQHDRCEAGQRYEVVKDTATKPYRLPCLNKGIGDRERADTCAAYESMGTPGKWLVDVVDRIAREENDR